MLRRGSCCIWRGLLPPQAWPSILSTRHTTPARAAPPEALALCPSRVTIAVPAALSREREGTACPAAPRFLAGEAERPSRPACRPASGGRSPEPAAVPRASVSSPGAPPDWHRGLTFNTASYAPSGGVTTATVSRTGQVLVTGGTRGGPVHAALYDPPSGRWRRTAAPSVGASGVWSTATRLPSGQVLLVAVASGQGIALAATARYDATTGRWTPTAPPPRHTALFGHTATLLQDGAVLVAGGATMTRVLAAAALYR